MSTKAPPEYIQGAGGCLVSKNILDGRGRLKWMTREPSANPADNGWRFFADIDGDTFVNTPGNIVVSDFNAVADIEPAIIAIYELPVGSDLQLVVEDGRRTIVDNRTGRALVVPGARENH